MTLPAGTPRRDRTPRQAQPTQSAQITRNDLMELEKALDQLFKTIGIDVVLTTNHFLQRVNDTRGEGAITLDQVASIFKKAYTKYNRYITRQGPDFEGVLRDVQSQLNVPFVLNWDRDNEELDLVAKSAMRKRDFRTRNKVLPV